MEKVVTDACLEALQWIAERKRNEKRRIDDYEKSLHNARIAFATADMQVIQLVDFLKSSGITDELIEKAINPPAGGLVMKLDAGVFGAGAAGSPIKFPEYGVHE